MTRVDGVLRTRISIEHGPLWREENPDLDPVVFSCSDPEFVPKPLLSEVPTSQLEPVHPGWKPHHRFDLPAAIIDPNGNIQIAGIRLTDGSLTHGSDCWNRLLRHQRDKA